MGLLVDGQWQDQWYNTADGGRFKRENAQRRNWVTANGEAGPSGEGGFKAEAGRYHLYVSLACPWAHRTLIFRKLKGLESLIDVSVVSWYMRENGWTFDTATGSTGDALDNLQLMHQRYTADDAHYTGRVTVPVLWDKKLKRIVSNESSEIIRMFNSAFDELTGNTLDFYPEALRGEIDALNERTYEEAYDGVFSTLDWLEGVLENNRYLAGDAITEADWRLFTTLIRFDAVYHGHFKCNLKRIEDYPNLSNWLRELYQWPGVAQTVDFEHIKHHYYASHRTINPTGVVPKGPLQDFDRPHDRG
ncbi:MAG: glutathione S-transferase family protein [Pseudomonas sp.]